MARGTQGVQASIKDGSLKRSGVSTLNQGNQVVGDSKTQLPFNAKKRECHRLRNSRSPSSHRSFSGCSANRFRSIVTIGNGSLNLRCYAIAPFLSFPEDLSR